MDADEIVTLLGSEIVGDIERAIGQGFIRSRSMGNVGSAALEYLLVVLLAAVVAPPTELTFAKQRAVKCADLLEDLVSKSLHMQKLDDCAGDQIKTLQ